MNISHPDWTFAIELTHGEVTTLVIENPITYRRVVEDLTEQINGFNGEIIISHNNKIFPLKKYLHLIYDPFNIDINSKNILTALYKELASTMVDSDCFYEYDKFQSIANNMFVKIFETSTTNFIWDDSPSINGLFKAFNVRLEETSTLAQKLITYIDLIQKYIMTTGCIVLIDIKRWFSVQEMEEIVSTLKYLDFHILFLESTERFELYNERIYIIDSDNCAIYEEE